MPVPTLVTDLSTTAASNSPSGSDNVFPDLDNYLRALSAFLASIRDNSGNGWTTPYLPLTYSAGTANGVLYLNGSKVVTTGSGLVFDGSNLGIGTSSLTARFESQKDSSATSPASDQAFPAWTSGAVLKNLSATNGAYSALSLLAANTAGTTQGYSLVSQSTSSGYASNLLFIARTAAGTGTVNATLDSSGNLGLGVTPSAWGGTSRRAIQFGPAGAIDSGTSTQVVVSANRYFSGSSDIYLNSAAASAYQQQSGAHSWYTAPSGTAGNAISFTQAMTLDASGNLSVGTTSSQGAKFAVNSGALPSGSAGLTFSAALSAGRLATGDTNNTTGVINQYLDTSITEISSGTSGAYAAGIVISGGTAAVNANTVRLFTAATERARITSGGDLLVGTTSAAGAGGITLQTGANGFALINNNNAAATGYVFGSFRRSSVEIGSITQNGTTGVLYNTTSDRRLKDNIVPAPSASNVIDAIQIVSHDWKAAPDEHVTYGVIAQDLALVAPQAVLQGDDGDEIEKTWGVDYSKLVPILIKEIQSLRARVAALEAKP